MKKNQQTDDKAEKQTQLDKAGKKQETNNRQTARQTDR